MGSYAGYLLETFLTLGVVCGVAFVVLYGARRMGVGRPHGPIELIGQLPLDARRSVYLVKLGEQVIVVGVAEGGMTKLGEFAAADLPPVPPRQPPTFAAIFARTRTRQDGRSP